MPQHVSLSLASSSGLGHYFSVFFCLFLSFSGAAAVRQAVATRLHLRVGAGGRPEFPVRRVANAGDGLRGGVAAARARRPGARPDVLALYGMQRRHRFRQFLTHFSATRRPSRAMYCAPLRARAYWMLIGACNPKIGPIHVSLPLSLPHAHSRSHPPSLPHAHLSTHSPSPTHLLTLTPML